MISVFIVVMLCVSSIYLHEHIDTDIKRTENVFILITVGCCISANSRGFRTSTMINMPSLHKKDASLH